MDDATPQPGDYCRGRKDAILAKGFFICTHHRFSAIPAQYNVLDVSIGRWMLVQQGNSFADCYSEIVLTNPADKRNKPTRGEDLSAHLLTLDKEHHMRVGIGASL